MRRFVVLVFVGVLLGGCRSNPDAPPAAKGSAEGSHAALVRDALIEAGAAAQGPASSERAQRAVRVWRGEGGGDAGG